MTRWKKDILQGVAKSAGKNWKELKNSIASNDTPLFLKRGANHKLYSTHLNDKYL